MPKIPPYTLEFKREAVKLLRSGDRSVPQLARDLGVSQGSLRAWAAQLDVDEGKAEGLSSALREELKRLRRENRVLAEELDFRTFEGVRGGCRCRGGGVVGCGGVTGLVG